MPDNTAQKEPCNDREAAVVPERAALLSIDMQNAEWSPEQAELARQSGSAESAKRSFLERMETVVIPTQKRLQSAARAAGIEVIFTVIESLTLDGREISLDHKISGLFFPKGSWEAQVIPDVAPLENEIVIPKTSSGIFNSTNIDYILRNLGIQYLVVYGVSTDQCVETAVRDAADRGFLVTLVEDCCAAEEDDRHQASLRAVTGHYCRTRSADEMIAEFERTGGTG